MLLVESLPHICLDYYDSCSAINLASATREQLDALMLACQPASFGHGGETVLDETYRKAGKLDASAFATPLVPERTDLAKIVHDFLFEGEQNKLSVAMELYKLNIYGKGSFFKEHVDTPHNGNMLGSLVLVFPTPHSGGELVLRPEAGDAYTFDSGNLLTPGKARIGYAAFYSDVAHEVLPVTDGHRVTLTFNLYTEDTNRRVPAPSTISARLGQCKDHLEQLLRDDALLPDGGLLVFGLQHAYPVKVNHCICDTYQMLKGVDRVLWDMLCDMDLDPDMHLLYDLESSKPDPRGLARYRLYFNDIRDEQWAESVVLRENTLREEKISRKNVVWVTPVNSLTRLEQAWTYYGNEASTEWMYSDLCLIARVKSYAARNELPASERGASEVNNVGDVPETPGETE
ncbi:hypothetical protein PENSPDRAFT_574026 [Peniophora sp. CONT]|nr:hypothetical protein PENSPDRAFT_574026 [Peniophora sp. CONT]